MLSKRVKQIQPSPTLAITAKAKKMQQEGIDIIVFGAGEPDFDTPENIKEKGIQAIKNGFTKYTATSGILELKEAIVKKFKNDNNLDYKTDEILVSCGAKHSLFNAIFSLCEDGDEVILPSPFWVSYLEMINISGGNAIIVETKSDTGFKITDYQLEKVLTKKTKLVILNSPCNPTGMMYNRDELEKIARVIVNNNLYCISDEIYEKIVYDDFQHVSIASLNNEIKNRTIVVNGVSKSYSMTGWRVGYAAGSKEIIQAMTNLQDHTAMHPSSISQKAALEALLGDQESVSKMVSAFNDRRDYMVNKINSIDGLSCLKPNGAFYIWVDISNILGKRYNDVIIDDSMKLTELLLVHAKVAVVPGVVFGNDKYIRLSFATSIENIKVGLDRIEHFVKQLN